MSTTIFEKGRTGRSAYPLPANDCPADGLNLPVERTDSLGLPEVGEQDLVRHYMELAAKVRRLNSNPLYRAIRPLLRALGLVAKRPTRPKL